MKRSLILSLCATVVLAACADQSTEPTASVKANFGVADAGRYLIQFDKGVPSSFSSTVSSLGGSVEQLHTAIGGAVVTGLSSSAAGQLAKLDGVNTVEADQLFNAALVAPLSVQQTVTPLTANNPVGASIFARQWNMRQINADDAWYAGMFGSPNVKVAILDTGIDPSNPDLQGRVDWANSTSFVAYDQVYINYYFPGQPSWIDVHYHGTHVAATVSSNAIIAAGVTENVTLMAVKVIGVNGLGATSGVLNGIMWAVDHGADVINMSLGTTFYKSDYPGFIALINRAVAYANSRGVTIVAAAGNDARDLDHDQDAVVAYCNAPNVICVSATGPSSEDVGEFGPWPDPDASAYYTNFGRSAISVAAPGGNGVTGVSAVCSRYSVLWFICGTGNFVLNAKGTSMAAAHVSGLAALLVDKYGRNPGRIRGVIERGAVDVGPKGADPRYGKGRIDVMNSLNL